MLSCCHSQRGAHWRQLVGRLASLATRTALAPSSARGEKQGLTNLYTAFLNSNWIPSASWTKRQRVLAGIFSFEMNFLSLFLRVTCTTLHVPTTGFRRQITLNVHCNTLYHCQQKDTTVKQIFTKKYYSLHAALIGRNPGNHEYTATVTTHPLSFNNFFHFAFLCLWVGNLNFIISFVEGWENKEPYTTGK